jgi:hypothetical protein
MLSQSETNGLLAYLFILFGDLIGYLYLLLKVYRVLCITKITFDQFPVLNPYKWPLSLIRVTTKPYFKFWSIILPNLKFGKSSFDVSSILGLEMLSSLINFSFHFRAFVLAEAQRIMIS